jgi:hypothetical protein
MKPAAHGSFTLAKIVSPEIRRYETYFINPNFIPPAFILQKRK